MDPLRLLVDSLEVFHLICSSLPPPSLDFDGGCSAAEEVPSVVSGLAATLVVHLILYPRSSPSSSYSFCRTSGPWNFRGIRVGQLPILKKSV